MLYLSGDIALVTCSALCVFFCLSRGKLCTFAGRDFVNLRPISQLCSRFWCLSGRPFKSRLLLLYCGDTEVVRGNAAPSLG